MLIAEPRAEYVVRPIDDATPQMRIARDAEHGDLAGRCVRRPEVHARHQQQRITLVELRELRVLPAELSHVVRVFEGHRVHWVPYLSHRNACETGHSILSIETWAKEHDYGLRVRNRLWSMWQTFGHCARSSRAALGCCGRFAGLPLAALERCMSAVCIRYTRTQRLSVKNWEWRLKNASSSPSIILAFMSYRFIISQADGSRTNATMATLTRWKMFEKSMKPKCSMHIDSMTQFR